MTKSILVVFAAAFCFALLFSSALEAKTAPSNRSTILMVLTGVEHIPGKEQETGFWAEEFVAPYKLFRKAGHPVIVASLNGGRVQVDPGSIDPQAVGREQARELRRALDNARGALNTTPLRQVRLDNVGALFIVGGHGVMWDLTDAPAMHQVAQKLFLAGKVVSAVCHGPGALVRVKLPDGRFLLDGRQVAGFSAREEELVSMTSVVPYCLEEEMQKASGGKYKSGEPWKSFVVVDGQIVTGQNPASSADTAQAVLNLLAPDNTRD